MAVRLQHRVFDDAPHQFAARLLAQLHLAPASQQFARPLLVAGFERITDIGEAVAELPETQRDVQQRRAPERRERPAGKLDQDHVDGKGRQGRQAHRQAPDHPTMVRSPGVEIPGTPAHPASHPRMNQVAARKRSNLLQEQRKHNREETHAGIIPRGLHRSSSDRATVQANRNR
jgi:hypothetical protein